MNDNTQTEIFEKASMTLKDAANQLTLSAETLRRLAISKQIPAIRIGKRWMVPTQYVKDLISGHAEYWTPGPHGDLQYNPPVITSESLPQDTNGAQ